MPASRCEYATHIDNVDIPYCKHHGDFCYLNKPDLRLCKELYGEALTETNVDEDDFIKEEILEDEEYI